MDWVVGLTGGGPGLPSATSPSPSSGRLAELARARLIADGYSELASLLPNATLDEVTTKACQKYDLSNAATLTAFAKGFLKGLGKPWTDLYDLEDAKVLVGDLFEVYCPEKV